MGTVSDLHCPATLVVARHAKAAFVETWFSDEGGSLTAAGRAPAAGLAGGGGGAGAQAAGVGGSGRGRRGAAVWCSDASRAVQTAEIVASRLGVAVTAR